MNVVITPDSTMTPGKRNLEVIIAGQVPPPMGGQNLVIERILRLLQEEPRIRVRHWPFRFTVKWSEGRKAQIGKLVELARVLVRLIGLRAKGRMDVTVYPVGGPHLIPLFRDMLILPWLRLCCPRVVLHFQAAGVAAYLQKLPGWMRWILRGMYRTCVTEAWVLTAYGKQDPEALGISTVHLLPNCVDLPAGERRPSSGGKTVFLNVGHLCPDKGTPALIKAFSAVAREDATLELRLVGECLAPYSEEDLRQDVSKSGAEEQIRLAGFKSRDEILMEYEASDLFVFASQAPYESFGLVMVEAMQAGLPVILTDWRGNAEVATPEVGGVVAAIDGLEASFREALSNRDQWEAWGKTNQHVVGKYYTPAIFRNRLLSLLCSGSEST